MRKAGKKLFAVLFAVTLLCAVSAGSMAVSAETDENNVWGYRILDNGTVSITEYYGPGGDVVIPEIIDGYRVTKISGYILGFAM